MRFDFEGRVAVKMIVKEDAEKLHCPFSCGLIQGQPPGFMHPSAPSSLIFFLFFI